MPAEAAPELLVGLARPDDAAVYRLGDGRVLIATVDFFTPIVDDPFDYGQIAAANSLSDVYAMGGTPFLALSIAAFPIRLPLEILTRVLQGAATKVREAGAVIAGGHTVRDEEPKFGLAVLGFGEEGRILTKDAAEPGDVIYLSKPLGSGAISTALKKDQLDAPTLQAAVIWMSGLSAGVSRAAVEAGCHAATDVTGFGLAGHALEMADASGVALVLDWDAVPALPGAREAIRAGHVPGGAKANQAAFAPHVLGLEHLGAADRGLLFDPQTSGGLLVAVPPAAVAGFEAGCSRAGATVWRIGRVAAGQGLQVSAGSAASE